MLLQAMCNVEKRMVIVIVAMPGTRRSFFSGTIFVLLMPCARDNKF